MAIINVSGNICSGKSTLSNLITKQMDYSPINTSIDESLLCAFFSDVKEFFLQEQLTIFLNKVMNCQTLLSQGKNIVFDRSLFEDIYIFADYFISHKEKFGISDDDINAYKYITNKIFADCPTADLTIICNPPAEICLKRMLERKQRNFERLYPSGHLFELQKQYVEIMPKINCKNKYYIDTSTYDITNVTNQSKIVDDIKSIIDNRQQKCSLSILKQFQG